MFRPMRRKNRAINEDAARQLLHTARRGILAVNGDDGYPCVSAAMFGARLGSAHDNWTEQLTNTAGQACPLAALLPA